MKILLTLLFAAASASAQVTLSPLFTDHAVLERDKPIPVWGTAAPNEKVTITLGPNHTTAMADAAGAWEATLPRLTAGGPYTLTANNASATDILIGEVWLASGQSNMEFTLKQIADLPATLATVDHPNLRMFTVKKNTAAEPTTALKGSWAVSNTTNALDFSAVGYYFAASLLDHLHVPIGIIHSSWGGTAAEFWTPLPNLLADPTFATEARRQTDAFRALPASMATYKQQLHAWESQYQAAEPTSTAIPSDTAPWQTITLPATMDQLPFHGAAVLWLRRSVTLPDNVPSTRAHIDLGPLLERVIVYVNGQQIARQGYGDPEIGVPSRAADIPAGVLHPGINTVLIRAFGHVPSHPGIGRSAMSISIPRSAMPGATQPAGNDTCPLTGDWQYSLAFNQPLPVEALASFPISPQMNTSSTFTSLYNAMIYPLRNFPIAGTIWYQGEQNAGHAAQYPGLMADLIAGWRKQWGYDFPFYLVQLPLFSDRNWVAQRASMAQITHDVPNTAMAVTIDTGSVSDIHPRIKQPVGERLALLALHRVYGLKLEDSGPFFAAARPEGATLRISFTHAEGLHATAATIPNFEIAGADGNFLPADATIDEQTIVLSNPRIPNPVSARYDWSAGPLNSDIYNAANLPLAPFQTP
jgi:sialate O-acetylesterase